MDGSAFERDVSAVRISSPDDIVRAAIALRAMAAEAADLCPAPTHNISDSAPMCDATGIPLATSIFGFRDDEREWWRVRDLALSSPLAMACRFVAEPFWCNEEGIRSVLPNRFLERIDLQHFQQRALARAAIVVPVHLPFGQIGAVSFLHRDKQVSDLSEVFRSHGAWLGALARTFVASYSAVAGNSDPLIGSPKLTRREVECLRWAAGGKTNEDIGDILGLKRSTVRFHLRNAAEKLNAVNRDQAIFKAAQLGFLGTA